MAVIRIFAPLYILLEFVTIAQCFSVGSAGSNNRYLSSFVGISAPYLFERKISTSTALGAQASNLVLNEVQACEDDSEGGLSDLDQQLRISIDNLYANFLDDMGEKVDYDALSKSEEFEDYKKKAALLESFDSSALSEDFRKAFFLNIYNCLVIHGLVELGEPKTWDDRLKLYSTVSYKIGGLVLTLDDIEHGVLRGNRAGGSHKEVPFPEGDPRAGLALTLDPRIHFALNCGAVSCPPIRFYEGEEIDDQLDLSTEAYLEDIEIEEHLSTVRLPKLLDWYGSDVSSTKSPEEILEWVVPFLYEEEKAEAVKKILKSGDLIVDFLPYNWDLND
uniref:DUF547 domain-containing protein n=1 Tax=Heterosigma akashiwo TaxID=2829 RepID=A0A6V2SG00_HETAK|mmetsp:Transcript_919/g.1457  ORF Transcript_919/g.1457 Transcript_919/m.1457 type:complete len:333 (-) Transcript_919:208-1206(-)